MSEFEDALRRAMSQPNKGFEQADSDLLAEVKAASVGIENLTNNRGSISLSPPREQPDGVWYEIHLLFRPVDSPAPSAERGTTPQKSYLLGTVFIPWKGYPLRTGYGRELPDRHAIAAHFLEMATDPASPLISYLTFNLRHQNTEAVLDTDPR